MQKSLSIQQGKGEMLLLVCATLTSTLITIFLVGHVVWLHRHDYIKVWEKEQYTQAFAPWLTIVDDLWRMWKKWREASQKSELPA